MKLSGYRKTAKGLPDLLNWAALVENGVVQCKSGALIAGWFYKGPDIGSTTNEQRNFLTARINAALAGLSSGWVSWNEAVRIPASEYPAEERSHFTSKIARMVDDERRERFLAEGEHFISEHAIVLMYTPPEKTTTRFKSLMWDTPKTEAVQSVAQQVLDGFLKALDEVEDGLLAALDIRRMGSYTCEGSNGYEHQRDELINFLQLCLVGEPCQLNLPQRGMYLDAVIGGVGMWPGDTPKVGDNYTCCVAMQGFPAESYPQILEVLESLQTAYRWSSRMIYLDREEAIGELKKYRRKWLQKSKGFVSQVFRTEGGIVNEDALLMASQAEESINDANSDLVRFGYYTPVIVLMSPDRAQLLENARYVSKQIKALGFASRIEDVNAMEAWLGSLPGHAYANIRRPLIHTLNLADMLPLSSVWAGLDFCSCDLYAESSPPLMHAAAVGATPFRLNLHVGDVGHTLIFGPTGAGKSVLLNTIAMQFTRYEGRAGEPATIFAFDRGRSMLATVKACGGSHYDLGSDIKKIGLAPLRILETQSDKAWAQDWVETCFELQTKQAPSIQQKEKIRNAIELLSKAGRDNRSITDLCATLQDIEVRSALNAYTIGASDVVGLDSQTDTLETTAFNVFEVDELLQMTPALYLPVLYYLFRRFERSLKGQPAMLAIGEAWALLGHPTFKEKIREWLKTLRKANCAVVMETQSVSDAVNSGLFDVLLESCPTKILLPNPEADKQGSTGAPGPYDYYTAMGLNEADINNIKFAKQKQEYYYCSPAGKRLFDLALGPVAMAFVGVSDKVSLARIEELEVIHADQWPLYWLRETGVSQDDLAA